MRCIRDDEGRYPAYAWPGGYPLHYVMADGESLCADCMNVEVHGVHESDEGGHCQARDWHCVGVDVHYEGQPIVCANCNAEIESAYGDPGR